MKIFIHRHFESSLKIILKRSILFTLLLFATSGNSANFKTNTFQVDTIRLTLILSPYHVAQNVDYVSELEEAYRQVEEGLELSNQMFGGLNQQVLEFLNERDFTETSLRKPLAKVVKKIELDTLSNAENITSILLAALDGTSDMYLENTDLKENIDNANAGFNVWLFHGSEVETQTVAGATGGAHIVLSGNGGFPHIICAHEIGHVGLVIDTTINSNGDTTMLATGIGHDFAMYTDQEYSIKINGVEDTLEIGTPSIMNAGPKGPYFSPESANGVVIGLKQTSNLFPHFEDKRHFVDIIDEDSNSLQDTTEADFVFILSKLIAYEAEERIESWQGVSKHINIKDDMGTLQFESSFTENEVVSSSINLKEGMNTFIVELAIPCTNEKISKEVVIFKRATSSISDTYNSEGVLVFPNPADQLLNVKFLKFTNLHSLDYKIFNSHAKQVQQGKINSAHSVLNIENLKSGLYLINFYMSKKIENLFFIKI